MRGKIIETIEKEKLIVIVRAVEREKLLPLTQAMYDGGIRLLEITYDASKKVKDEETAENIKLISKHFAGKMFIGAGTVLTTAQVELTKKSGGCFIISPNTDSAVIKKTVELDMVSMPGALTPTEIQYAHGIGADFVKLFPASNLGFEYIKAIKAPLSNIRLTAVGGISESNISDYIKAGVSGFGIGTNIVDKKMLADNNYDGIRKLAKKYVNAVK